MQNLYEKAAAHYNISVSQLMLRLTQGEPLIHKYYVAIGHFDKNGNPNC